MRELDSKEIDLVAGGVYSCKAENDYGGIIDTGSFGRDLINLYEGAVAATSHVIERVANAFSN